MIQQNLTRRSFLTLAGLGIAGTALAGCSGGGGAAAETTEDGKTVILFWNSMDGSRGDALQKVVDGFNAQSDEFEVRSEYQGSYDESTGSFFNMANGAGAPAIVQIGEQNLQAMIDSGLVANVSELISAQSFDDSDLLEQAVNFYTYDGAMYAMPFNCSCPVVYYNQDVLDAAGVTELPTTFEGLTAAAEAIAASSDVTPVGLYAYGYALDQMVTNMGGYVVNNENGRKERCTEVAYRDQMAVIFNWVKSLNDAGQFSPFSSGDDAISGFSQQQCAIYIDTSASARQIIDACSFNVSIGFLPVEEGAEAMGIYAGGGALCIADGLSEDVARGVMEFCAYATSPDVQATWAGDTGYFPISNGAYETETLSAVYGEYPQLQVSAEQLRSSKVNNITAGPLCSQLPQLRTDLQTALQSVFNGGDVDEALDTAVQSTNTAIESANQGVA
ncbi:ABC transporter substrate-binding protein [Collinsella sp. An268]|uniref:ABC transporter substrate-binding protein n=1 Tax=Collinsella sp. An268 TaxID=1965612 RepID=UPI000B3A5BDD|nr:ABC transporter substrate-binding protein [Collinsella sp. An268]OUO64999.1 hypothetical protein B5F70_02795 [Collinsella sp. An268]